MVDCFNLITGSFQWNSNCGSAVPVFCRSCQQDMSNPPGWEPIPSRAREGHGSGSWRWWRSPATCQDETTLLVIVVINPNLTIVISAINPSYCSYKPNLLVIGGCFLGAFLVVFMSNHPLFELGCPGSPWLVGLTLGSRISVTKRRRGGRREAWTLEHVFQPWKS